MVGMVLARFLTMIPGRLSVGKGPVEFNAMLVTIDEETGLATDLARLQETVR